MCLSDEWARLCASRDDEANLAVTGASIGLQDGYYQFAAESVSSWFCLGERFLAGEVGTTEVYSEATGQMEPISADRQVWAFFRGLPMG